MSVFNFFRQYATAPVMWMMVTGMKYLNRLFPRITRWFVHRIADSEVIACGLMRDDDNKPIVIYSPHLQKGHWVSRVVGFRRHKVRVGGQQRYVGNLVIHHDALESSRGDVYQVVAKKLQGGAVYSPRIMMKMKTEYYDSVLLYEKIDMGFRLSWRGAKQKMRTMIYFLGFSEVGGDGVFGVYTRETKFTYPCMREGSHFIFSGSRIKVRDDILKRGKEYEVRLLCVDYQGWVPLVSRLSFSY